MSSEILVPSFSWRDLADQLTPEPREMLSSWERRGATDEYLLLNARLAIADAALANALAELNVPLPAGATRAAEWEVCADGGPQRDVYDYRVCAAGSAAIFGTQRCDGTVTARSVEVNAELADDVPPRDYADALRELANLVDAAADEVDKLNAATPPAPIDISPVASAWTASKDLRDASRAMYNAGRHWKAATAG